MPNQTKITKYLRLKKNPVLELYKMFNELREELQEKIKQEITTEVGKIKQTDLTNASFIEELVSRISNRSLSNLLKDIKGDKGEQGGQGQEGKQGEQGKQGIQGLSGKDGIDGKQGLKGLDAKDGKTPILGMDYFTKSEKEELLSRLKSMIKLEPLAKEIQDIKKLLKEMSEKQTKLGGRRVIHRGGTDFEIDELVGTGDGSTTSFDLDNVPYDNSSIITLTVGGGLMFLTDDYTRSGKTITFITAPPSGAKIRATYRK